MKNKYFFIQHTRLWPGNFSIKHTFLSQSLDGPIRTPGQLLNLNYATTSYTLLFGYFFIFYFFFVFSFQLACINLLVIIVGFKYTVCKKSLSTSCFFEKT